MEKSNTNIDTCIVPPSTLSKEEKAHHMQNYMQCESDRLENQKSVLNSLLTEKNSSGIKFPGLTIITSRLSKNKELVTFSNGIDSLETEVYTDFVLQYIPRLSGMTHMKGGTMHGYTFDSENPDEIRTIAKVTLQLLEIHRYPERFGYNGPISYMAIGDKTDKLRVQDARGEAMPIPLPYIPGIKLTEILTYIDTVINNIPKEKSIPQPANEYDTYDIVPAKQEEILDPNEDIVT